MRLSLLSLTIAIIFVLAIVHAPVEANAVADPEAASLFWGIPSEIEELYEELKDILNGGINAICKNQKYLEKICKFLGLKPK